MTRPQRSPGWMTESLGAIFGELGISQYLEAFLDQGFDSWDTILDITESDLDALGVKLGHRRKLQRRIANTRGVAPAASLVSPTRLSIEDPKLDVFRPDGPKITDLRDAAAGGIVKRKYRRHPKPDENAPQRPPSAYVLFSNKMRDDLKGKNLTFTEIAKLVGENWQNLPQADKKSFESQAQADKDKYNNDLAEYKKTTDYKKYTRYLQEFKAKQAHQSHDKDGAKRIKVSEGGDNGHNGIARDTPNRTSRSRSRSGSEGHPENTPTGQHMRFGSIASTRESHSAATPTSYYASVDESVHSPSSLGPDRSSQERSPVGNTSPGPISSIAHIRGSGWSDDPRGGDQVGMPRQLPPLSDMLDQRNGPPGSEGPAGEVGGFPFPRTHSMGSPGPPPGLIGGESRPQTLSKEQSWAGSSSSGSSLGYPRTPIDGPLAIHALLSSKSDQQHESMPLIYGSSVPLDYKAPLLEQRVNSNPLPFPKGLNSGPLPMITQPPPLQKPAVDGYSARFKAQPSGKPDPNLDGMSALLRAGEIVDRRTR